VVTTTTTAGPLRRDQFAALDDRLRTIQRRFILSINDMPQIRTASAGFSFDQVELRYSTSGGRGQPARELTVSGRAGSRSRPDT
jgi:DNA adenine methylase